MIDVGYEHIWENLGFILLMAGALLAVVSIVMAWHSRDSWDIREERIALFAIMPLAVALLTIGIVTFLNPPLNTDRLENAYGIEQLECSNDACTWLKGGQPAAGTLVRRGDTAGLLDSNQTPLPVVNGEAM